MTSSRSLLGPALAVCAGILSAQQQPARAPAPPKPGIPGVQAPMSYLIPDAQYRIEANGVKGGPDWLAITDDAVYTNSRGTDTVFRLDPRSDKVVAAIPVKKPCSGFAIAAGTLWSPSCEDHNISRIDLKTNEVVSKVPVGPANSEGGIAFGAGSAWMPSDPKGVVSRIDPATNKIIASITVPPDSFTAVYGYNLVWVSSTAKSVVSVIHPATNAVIAEIPVDKNPRFMAVGEGYVWTLNQGTGTVSKIDPRTMKVVATIDAGVPGTGGDIAAGEGALWVTQKSIPVTRIDPASNTVTSQLVGPGGDAMRVGLGYVWLSNGREGKVWRFLAAKVVSAAPHRWIDDAQKADLDGDGKPDVLVEDLAMFVPGEPATFRMKVLNPALGSSFTLKTILNGKEAQSAFTSAGDVWSATLGSTEPRWIHYSVCAAKSGVCSPELVVASPTTSVAYATGKATFVPDKFMVPPPPSIGDYTWNILEPEILTQDYGALQHVPGRSGGNRSTTGEDYGELKRHRWEFQHLTSFAYGILTPDGTEEVACVYVNPSKKQGYDATVRFMMTERGMKEGLEPALTEKVRQWIKTEWPFAKVAFPGVDIPMAAWNALPDSEGGR
ncbi:MAG TPA: YncE family protein [Bryobacteraceae bacterium]|jgi:YVTN family beta-propeller protein